MSMISSKVCILRLKRKPNQTQESIYGRKKINYDLVQKWIVGRGQRTTPPVSSL